VLKFKPFKLSDGASTVSKLIRFLQDELAIPAASIDLAVRHPEQTPNLLPMVLWQYGLITIEQLDQIFDWLETS
jgi:hypothetical protein